MRRPRSSRWPERAAQRARIAGLSAIPKQPPLRPRTGVLQPDAPRYPIQSSSEGSLADQDRHRRADEHAERRHRSCHAEAERLRRLRHAPGMDAAARHQQQAQPMQDCARTPRSSAITSSSSSSSSSSSRAKGAYSAKLACTRIRRSRSGTPPMPTACRAARRSLMTPTDSSTNSGASARHDMGPRAAWPTSFPDASVFAAFPARIEAGQPDGLPRRRRRPNRPARRTWGKRRHDAYMGHLPLPPAGMPGSIIETDHRGNGPLGPGHGASAPGAVAGASSCSTPPPRSHACSMARCGPAASPGPGCARPVTPRC